MILLQKKTDFTFLSRYRGALMGVAILWIYLYHQGPIGIPGYDQVVPIGWAGVEIFFLLSAIRIMLFFTEKWQYYSVLPTKDCTYYPYMVGDYFCWSYSTTFCGFCYS